MTELDNRFGTQVIAYWYEKEPNTIYLTETENTRNYIRPGYAYRDSTEHEYEMFLNGTRQYEKIIK